MMNTNRPMWKNCLALIGLLVFLSFCCVAAVGTVVWTQPALKARVMEIPVISLLFKQDTETPRPLDKGNRGLNGSAEGEKAAEAQPARTLEALTEPEALPTAVSPAVEPKADQAAPAEQAAEAKAEKTDQAPEVDQGPKGEALRETKQGSWEVSFYEGSTDQMNGWFERLRDPQPEIWKVFPNQPNPDIADNNVWRVVEGPNGPETPDGLYYGLDESVFGAYNNAYMQVPIQARGYRIITGDYDIPNVDSCQAEEAEAGCSIMLINVGEVTADLAMWVRQGFSVEGRYFNGDTLEVAMWAASSHVSANMLNMPVYADLPNGAKVLNDPDFANAGANCSIPAACDRNRMTIVVTSGNQVLVKATTYVERP